MSVSLIICIATCACMILSVLFFPKIRIGKIKIDTYWIITVIGAVLALIFGEADPADVGKALIADTAVNPLKILTLFISMTVLSIFLDELGFFKYLANFVLRRARSGQTKLFFYLYVTVSVLTVFTSNDIIILSFTPFICYFSENAKINPIPYLVAEFVAANTWSMALIIGNPTNIYLATAYGIGFLKYIKYSIFPTLFGGMATLGILYLLFRKKLKEPMCHTAEDVKIEDKPLFVIGIVHLTVCTVLLAVSSYIGVEMWIIAVSSACSLLLCNGIAALIRRKKPTPLLGCLRRAPYQLIPFMLSMFVMIVVLDGTGFTVAISGALGADLPILKYGTSSFLAANLINNIPMSVLFSSIIQTAESVIRLPAVFATVIGSNVGAFFTPIGALAGMMWSSLIGEHNVRFGYVGFLKIGLTVAIPALFASLGGLWLAVSIFGT